MHIELNGRNGRLPLEESPYDSMHPVHDPAVDSEDDRMDQIDFLNKPHVLGDVTDRELSPVRSVQFPNGIDRHLSDGEIAAQFDEAIHIPRVQTSLARPEVVLLPHPFI